MGFFDDLERGWGNVNERTSVEDALGIRTPNLDTSLPWSYGDDSQVIDSFGWKKEKGDSWLK